MVKREAASEIDFFFISGTKKNVVIQYLNRVYKNKQEEKNFVVKSGENT